MAAWQHTSTGTWVAAAQVCLAPGIGTELKHASCQRLQRQLDRALPAANHSPVSRSQLSGAERPTYEVSGQHLHGADAAIFERVRAEVAAVHGGALAAAGASEKKWTIEARTK